MERAISVNFLRSTGALVVQCIPGSKAPVKGYDPRNNTPEHSKRVLEEIEFTQDNFGVHLTGNLVDVDVDTENPVLFNALDAFLPNTPHIWGRASKPRSHRVYSLSDEASFVPSSYPVLQRLKRIPEAQMELRGGPVSRGEYSIMPGSTHPSGEAYTWDHIGKARSTPVMVTLSSVLGAMRKAAAVAVLAPYWTEGVRQELTMAIAGFLHRLTVLDAGLGGPDIEGKFLMGFDESVTFVKVLLDCVDDDASDRKDRLAAFKKTWKKAEEGQPVTGATRISEIASDDGIVRKLYSLLSDNPDVQKLEGFLHRFAIWVGPGHVIDMTSAGKGESKPILSRQGFANSYGHEFMMVGGKQRLIADALFSMSSTTRVVGMTFHPEAGTLVDTRLGPKVNMWGGFEIEPHPSPVSDEEMTPLRNYIDEVICSGRADLTHWVTSWIADIFQKPARKPGTALVLVGLPGAGKTFLGENILIPIIGEHAAVAVNDLERVTQKHNTGTTNMMFIQCNEATNSRQKATTARLKSIITDKYQLVEPKGVDAFQVPNFSRFQLTSNDTKDAVHLPDGLEDRRMTIIKVSDMYVGKEKEYWHPFLAWCQQNLPKIHRWLRDYKYDPAILRRCITTDEKVEMAAASWRPLDAWLAASVSEQHPIPSNLHTSSGIAVMEIGEKKDFIDRGEWPNYVSARHLAMACLQYSQTRGGTINPTKFVEELAGMGLCETLPVQHKVYEYDQRTGNRMRVNYKYVRLAPLDDFKEYLKKTLKFEDLEVNVVDTHEEDEKVEF